MHDAFDHAHTHEVAEHTHSHDTATTESHVHAHTHTHSHVHSHSHVGESDNTMGNTALEPIYGMMAYLLEHNQSHGNELLQISEKLAAMELGEAATVLKEGVALFAQGNEKLEQALSMVKAAQN